MIEIFEDISEQARKNAEFVFNMAMRQKDISQMVKTLNKYTNACTDIREREFVEFYFNLQMESLKNGNFYNQW